MTEPREAEHSAAGDDPTTAGPGDTGAASGRPEGGTPKSRAVHINPSAPNDGNITPGSMPEK